MKRVNFLIGVLGAAVIALSVLVARIYLKEDNTEKLSSPMSLCQDNRRLKIY